MSAFPSRTSAAPAPGAKPVPSPSSNNRAEISYYYPGNHNRNYSDPLSVGPGGKEGTDGEIEFRDMPADSGYITGAKIANRKS